MTLQGLLAGQFDGQVCRLVMSWPIEDDSVTTGQILAMGQSRLAQVCDANAVVLTAEPVFTFGPRSLRVTCAAVAFEAVGPLIDD